MKFGSCGVGEGGGGGWSRGGVGVPSAHTGRQCVGIVVFVEITAFAVVFPLNLE